IVTKRPKGYDETLVQAGIGTSDYYRATIDSNVRVSDVAAVRLNAMYHENDVPRRDHDRYERWGVAPSVKLGLDGPTSLTLLYTHQEDENTPLYGVPYYKNGVFDGPLPGAPYSGYYGYKNIDRQDQTIDQATAIFDHRFSDVFSIRNLSRWQRVEPQLVVNPPQGDYCLANGLLANGDPCSDTQTPGTYYPRGPRGGFRNSENQTLYNQLDLTFAIPGGHSLVIGTSALQEDYTLDTGNVLRNPDGALPNPALDPIDISNPDAIYTGPVNAIRTRRDDGDLFNLSAYAFAAVKIVEQLELNGGIRWEHNRARFRSDSIATPATGGAYTTGARQESTDDLFSYRVGLVFKPVEYASLYIAYGNSKNPVSTTVRSGCGLADEGNNFTDPCDIKPEQAVNYEIGGKIDLFDRQLQLSAALFRNERTNYRVTSNDPLIGDLAVNDGRNRVNGVTLGATGNITPAWTIFANYTYLDSKVLQSISDYDRAQGEPDDQAGNPMTNTPKHSGSLFTTYTLPFGLQLGYGLTYQGSWYLSNRSG
ncbi:MAG: TonB-dependent receptor, partial [Pseudomonadota bacterium]|nr:TonB-dependent receptor [Pseudomonadota bacterium]